MSISLARSTVLFLRQSGLLIFKYLFNCYKHIFFFVLELPRKRKYIPESELETQCDSDDEFQNSQTYDDWEPGQENEDILNSATEGTKKPTKDCGTYAEISTKDVSTLTENIMVQNKEQYTTVMDIHGCKYFGQFVSNELLRFNISERYIIMQKIIETLKK